LQRRFQGRIDHVINYFTFVARELREIMAQLGVRTVNEMIGRTDLLQINSAIIPWKAKELDYSRILYKPPVSSREHVYCTTTQNHGIDKILDRQLIEYAKPALEEAKPVRVELEIKNNNRTTGAMLSGEVCKRYGENGLPEDTIHIKFKGVAVKVLALG
jgi:glutamate synthase (NADPH/NADH) large chain